MTTITNNYLGSVAKMRLYNEILKEDIMDEILIQDAINEFIKIMRFFTGHDRWKYCMSSIHNKIWKLAVIDTQYYPELCKSVCNSIRLPYTFIHYEPNIDFGIGTTSERKLITYLKFINTYNELPKEAFWSEISLHITIPLPSISVPNSDLGQTDMNQPIFNSSNINSTETAITQLVDYIMFGPNQSLQSFIPNNTMPGTSNIMSGTNTGNINTLLETSNTLLGTSNTLLGSSHTLPGNIDIVSDITNEYLTDDDENQDNYRIKLINLLTSEIKEITINKNKKAGHLYKKISQEYNKPVSNIKLIFHGRILRYSDVINTIFNDELNNLHVLIRD